MLDKTSIIIPISLNDEIRAKLFRWVKSFYENVMPEVELCIGVANEKPFSKAKAINEAVRSSKGQYLVLADADIFYNPKLIEKSIEALAEHPWVIPYNEVLNVHRGSTDELIQTEPQWPVSIELDTRPRTHGPRLRGGINIVTRENFDLVGGFDERFTGWGGEDDAFASSLNHLCGHYKRLEGTIYHLWHPANNSSDENYKANIELLKRYSNKEAVLEEIRKREK
ncbi:galactosyltransferase-related protein [Aciduricibacillus chroicocephali]|uniref:Galactosyltransferase-related protein n=1 Tax=Aciduricibacillus chroicocephali TaxID=3054939 RepID=A0ABY9KWT0_9BACI|nr:galactosyltransferase-related protein [Bacillaceae bacterium 44XB]